MKTYWPGLALVFVSFLALPTRLLAQDEQPSAPLEIGGFEAQGSVTVGYRFTDIKGRRQKYLELFNLQDGFRMMDLNLFGQALKDTNRFADDFSLGLSGLGGDPFPAAQFTVRKHGLYDLRANYRQSYYYWDRNDNAVLPSGLHGLTTNHDWATVRKFGSLDFNLRASDSLRFSFEYYRASRDGVNFATRSLDYFGSPSLWGSFARANPYYVEAPLSEAANRVTGGVDYKWQDWNFHYRLGYQIFEDNLRGKNLNSPQRSINLDDRATANERVSLISWSEFRQFKTPVSEFSYVGKINPKLELRGDYTFYRYRGPATLDGAFNGSARTNSAGTEFAPYSVSLNTRAQVSEPNHVVDQGLTIKVKEWWNVLFDYRYLRFTVDSLAHFHSLRDTTESEGDALNQWRLGMHEADISFEFLPATSLMVRTGVRLLKRDVEALENGLSDPIRSKRIKTVWPSASVYYQPSKMFSIRGDFDTITNGTSYTRISPHTDIGSRFVARFRPTEKFYIEDDLLIRNRRFLETGFQNNFRNNSILATYEFNEKISAFGGLSYGSFFATDAVTFLRGTPPLNVVWRDQTIDRIWQCGFAAKLHSNFGLSFSGNYMRTTGRGEISGEAPLYGPLTYPYATGTLYYDFPRLGRFSVDLQRTYYLEQIVTGDNFSANLLTIRWTRDF